MKTAVLSDIHGNVWALEAVFNDAKLRGVDSFINLGDSLYGPLKPLETYKLLQSINAVTILGNQDRLIYEAFGLHVEKNDTLGYVISELGNEPVTWLKSLQKTAFISSEIFACHGSPSDDTVYLLEDVAKGFPVVKIEKTIIKELSGIDASLFLCGHSHLPRIVRLSTGQIIINPGSVGLPAYDDDLPVYHIMQTCSPSASYAIIERKNNTWSIDLLKVNYNYQAAAEQAAGLKRIDWAEWLASGKV